MPDQFMKTTVDLSIIIPAFNEERRLPQTLSRVRAFLKSRPGTSEVIVVDDGSTDGTAQLVQKMSGTWPELHLLKNPGNRGKGYSVRHGMLESQGEIVLFTDADLSAPIEEADKLFAALKTHDAAIGSRDIDRSLIEVHQSRSREVAGMMFNLAVRLILALPFQDTQCGFKAFTSNRAHVLFEQQRIERFGFDPELLFLAKRHGLTVAEVPVRWAHDEGTRVHALRDGMRMVFDVFRIRWNSLAGRYPQQKGS
jgi:glycosyltransferase involved in cell wall biosynthesis